MLRLLVVMAFLCFGCGNLEVFAVDNLTARGGYLLNDAGEKVVLRGMSTHGLAWYQSYYHKNSIKNLKEFWNTNVVRLAMYTEEWGGYAQNPGIKNKVIELVDAAIELDMYVIIDWHILKDGNPQTNADKAEWFFNEMSKKYADVPNVIYEICNEPNGYARWDNSIKPYANRIIPVIRRNAPKALVIVGTGTWSQDIQDPANSPLSFDNVAYALHFYAGTHGDWLRQRIGYAKSKGATIFVTEWGMSRADGGGGVYANETMAWLDYLAKEKISWCNWSLAPKMESSAALRDNAPASGDWNASHLSESGRWVHNYLTSHRE